MHMDIQQHTNCLLTPCMGKYRCNFIATGWIWKSAAEAGKRLKQQIKQACLTMTCF